MKSFFNALYKFLEDMGRARAATELTRQGDHKGALAIMESK